MSSTLKIDLNFPSLGSVSIKLRNLIGVKTYTYIIYIHLIACQVFFWYTVCMAKLPKIKTIRNKCDKLLTPIIKAMHPHCILREAKMCAGFTEVAHHHILKSKCTALRYELDNLIPLCTRCHMLLHSHESYYSSILVQRKGVEWFESLEAQKNKLIKADVHFYIENYERLKEIHDEVV